MKQARDLAQQLREATRQLLDQGPMAATAAIQQALGGGARGAGVERPLPPTGPEPEGSGPAEQAVPAAGQVVRGTYRNAAGSRDYTLYLPRGYSGQAMPLVVMLHGCTQDPDDFAAGTQMNAVADACGCLVVYPAQSASANPQRCWNWFGERDQQRGQGEPSLIAGIVGQVGETYAVNQRQVFVAGLSAGGAMAAIVGTLYPELFAAVGVHSGLPFGSAHDLPSALAAMKRGAAGVSQAAGKGVPFIVFHGDRDATVSPRNGQQLVARGLEGLVGGDRPVTAASEGSVPGGRSYTRTTYHHADGQPLGEHWVIHGAGHAWSGGSSQGSYTDGRGPDASRELMRFFLALG